MAQARVWHTAMQDANDMDVAYPGIKARNEFRKKITGVAAGNTESKAIMRDYDRVEYNKYRKQISGVAVGNKEMKYLMDNVGKSPFKKLSKIKGKF